MHGCCVIPHDAHSTREAVAACRLYLRAFDAEFIAAARTDVPALLAEVQRLQDAVERVRALAEGWRYKGEFGWGAWHGPDESGLALDDAATKILRALDGADDE